MPPLSYLVCILAYLSLIVSVEAIRGTNRVDKKDVFMSPRRLMMNEENKSKSSVTSTMKPSEGEVDARVVTEERTVEPSTTPSATPTTEPTLVPSPEPSTEPTEEPSDEPSVGPTESPSDVPSTRPSDLPTSNPSNKPSTTPSSSPTEEPSSQPSSQPTELEESIALSSNSPSSPSSSFSSVTPSTFDSFSPVATEQPASSNPTELDDVQFVVDRNSPSSTASLPPSQAPLDSMVPFSSSTGFSSQVPSFYSSSVPTTTSSDFSSAVPSSISYEIPVEASSESSSSVPSFFSSQQPSVALDIDSNVPSLTLSDMPSSENTAISSDAPTATILDSASAVPSSQPVPTSPPVAKPTISGAISNPAGTCQCTILCQQCELQGIDNVPCQSACFYSMEPNCADLCSDYLEGIGIRDDGNTQPPQQAEPPIPSPTCYCANLCDSCNAKESITANCRTVCEFAELPSAECTSKCNAALHLGNDSIQAPTPSPPTATSPGFSSAVPSSISSKIPSETGSELSSNAPSYFSSQEPSVALDIDSDKLSATSSNMPSLENTAISSDAPSASSSNSPSEASSNASPTGTCYCANLCDSCKANGSITASCQTVCEFAALPSAECTSKCNAALHLGNP